LRFGRTVQAEIFNVPALVVTLGHVVERHVGQRRQDVPQLFFDSALFRFAGRDEFLELGDFGHQLRGLGLVLLRLGLTDLLGKRIALFLGLVQPNNDLAAALVDGDEIGGADGHILALRHCLVEGVRIVSDPLDIEHRCLRAPARLWFDAGRRMKNPGRACERHGHNVLCPRRGAQLFGW
jgi:hypothetical protein